MTTPRLATLLVAAAMAVAVPTVADARPGGGGPGFSGRPGHGPVANHWHGNGGGYRGWNHGWGHRGWGWGPGVFWGGLGVGIGLGAIGYSYADPWYGYAQPAYIVAPPVAEYTVIEPAPGDRVVRSNGRPVPPVSRAPDPIFYPKNGQPGERVEADRQDCNRWATTQAGAMSDASIFQRATFACMEGRGYVVR